MATYVLKWADQGGSGNVISPDCAGDIVENVYELDFSQAPLKGVTLADGDLIDLGLILGNTTVSEVLIDSDDLDTNGTPAMSIDVGVMSGTPGDGTSVRTVGSEFFAADTTVRAGGVARMTKSAGFRVAASQADRSIGLKVVAAAATQASTTTGKLRVIVRSKG